MEEEEKKIPLKITVSQIYEKATSVFEVWLLKEAETSIFTLDRVLAAEVLPPFGPCTRRRHSSGSTLQGDQSATVAWGDGCRGAAEALQSGCWLPSGCRVRDLLLRQLPDTTATAGEPAARSAAAEHTQSHIRQKPLGGCIFKKKKIVTLANFH